MIRIARYVATSVHSCEGLCTCSPPPVCVCLSLGVCFLFLVHRVWEEKLRIKAGRGLNVGTSETLYEPIWVRDILQSPAMCLTYCGDTNQLIVGHYDGEIQVKCVCSCAFCLLPSADF